MRTARRWLARYRADGLVGLACVARTDIGKRKLLDEMVETIKDLFLRKPRPSWPEVESLLYDWGLRERSTGKMLAAMSRSQTLFYTPAVSVSARVLNRDIHRLLAGATA